MKCETKNGVFFVYAELIPHNLRQKRRNDFNATIKQKHDPQYNYHHKIPLSIGGSNSKSNVILMPKVEHELLHKYIIDPQIESMVPRRQKRIMLPIMDGPVFSLLSDNFKVFLKRFEKTGADCSEIRKYINMVEESTGYKDLVDSYQTYKYIQMLETCEVYKQLFEKQR